MPSDIATCYAQALFESAKTAPAVDTLLEQLTAIAQLIRAHAELGELIINPDVDPPEKVAILKRLLGGATSPLLEPFLLMVAERGRTEFLPEIADAFHDEVDRDRGRLRATVRSARPLPEELVLRVRRLLERREGKTILLQTETAPELLGGLQVVMGHRVIDGSIQRQVQNLRERLNAVRVA
ncbi:MAG: ATP synthase F1 subunit delta [Candidatus Omnitrophica bacterium]|nr:ATP synthase F1 subunit delta [Candidatus Omnitrophota bacterium]